MPLTKTEDTGNLSLSAAHLVLNTSSTGGKAMTFSFSFSTSLRTQASEQHKMSTLIDHCCTVVRGAEDSRQHDVLGPQVDEREAVEAEAVGVDEAVLALTADAVQTHLQHRGSHTVKDLIAYPCSKQPL